MQYSPDNAIMTVSMVDAGTVEFFARLGKQIVSSADLVSQFEAVLNEEQMASHGVAQRPSTAFWPKAGRRLAAACVRSPERRAPIRIRSRAMALRAMRREGLVWDDGPNVSVNANCSDSHYEPTAALSAPIREGDFLLIDIWARVNKPDSVYYDITWTGVVGREPSAREQLSSRRW